VTARRKLTPLDKLKIMTAQSRCPLCGEKLGALADVQFDHIHALALGGTDTLDNLRAVHIACHAVKTRGNGATTRGSDVGEIAHSRHVMASHAEFRARLLAKDAGEKKPRSKWASRPFPKRNHEHRRNA
jgi:5-methylcytosine-specific restriction endonuclease McrA